MCIQLAGITHQFAPPMYIGVRGPGEDVDVSVDLEGDKNSKPRVLKGRGACLRIDPNKAGLKTEKNN